MTDPIPVDDVDVAFPGDVSRLMVPYDEIPDEFKKDRHPCVQIMQEWFYRGIKKDEGHFVAAAGIDTKLALRHLKCIMGSFHPKHEHKTACVAYLLSEWFDEIAVGTLHWRRT